MPAATAPRVIIEPGQGEDPRLDGLVELVRDTTGRGPLLAASAAESAALARQILAPLLALAGPPEPAGGAGGGHGVPPSAVAPAPARASCAPALPAPRPAAARTRPTLPTRRPVSLHRLAPASAPPRT